MEGISNEIWKELTYRNCTFKISNKGRVSNESKDAHFGNIDAKGYRYFWSGTKRLPIHRMVMLAFGPPIKLEDFELLTVKYKGDKDDNNIDNLEYKTTYRTFKNSNKPLNIYQYSMDKKIFIKKFESAREIEIELRIGRSSISKCCTGIISHIGNCYFTYNKIDDPSIIEDFTFKYQKIKRVNFYKRKSVYQLTNHTNILMEKFESSTYCKRKINNMDEDKRFWDNFEIESDGDSEIDNH